MLIIMFVDNHRQNRKEQQSGDDDFSEEYSASWDVIRNCDDRRVGSE